MSLINSKEQGSMNTPFWMTLFLLRLKSPTKPRQRIEYYSKDSHKKAQQNSWMDFAADDYLI